MENYCNFIFFPLLFHSKKSTDHSKFVFSQYIRTDITSIVIIIIIIISFSSLFYPNQTNKTTLIILYFLVSLHYNSLKDAFFIQQDVKKKKEHIYLFIQSFLSSNEPSGEVLTSYHVKTQNRRRHICLFKHLIFCFTSKLPDVLYYPLSRKHNG